jgi:hypothetical protein
MKTIVYRIVPDLVVLPTPGDSYIRRSLSRWRRLGEREAKRGTQNKIICSRRCRRTPPMPAADPVESSITSDFPETAVKETKT